MLGSMKLLVLLGLLSAVLVMAVPMTAMNDASDDVADAESSLQLSQHQSQQWFKKIRKSVKKAFKKSRKAIRTRVGCHAYKNRCLCGKTTCFLRKKRSNKAMCKTIHSLCKLIATDPKLVKIAREEAKNVFSENPHGVKEAEAELAKIPMITEQTSKIHLKLKRLVREFYKSLSKPCRQSVRSLKLEVANAKGDPAGRAEILKSFERKCIAFDQKRAQQAVEELLQLTNADHQSWGISLILENLFQWFGR